MKLILSGGYLIFEPLRYGIKVVLRISYGVGLATCLREASEKRPWVQGALYFWILELDSLPIGAMVLVYMVTWIPSIYRQC